MQNHTSTNSSLISERVLSLVADGVSQFPHVKDISLCEKCVRVNTRKRVVVEQNISHKKFFVLAEFPEPEDESSPSVFSKEAATGVILNLLEKLGIADECHQSFALKCVSQKHIPDDHLAFCVLENLRQEFRSVTPKIVLCFGARAFFALSQFVMLPGSFSAQSGSVVFTFENQAIEVYTLPTAQELKQFPHWRAPVWSKLVHFMQKKGIAS